MSNQLRALDDAYAAGVAEGERRVRERVEAAERVRDAAIAQCRHLHQDGKTRRQWHLDNCGAMRGVVAVEAVVDVWDANRARNGRPMLTTANVVERLRAALAGSSPDPEGLPKDAPWPRDECGNRGPRIGEDGTLCRRSKGHVGQHRTAPSDGFGDVRWKNWDAPEPEATGDCVRHTALSTGRDVCLTHERDWPCEATGDDVDLPGMWERADFAGGDPDTRSHPQRERDSEAVAEWREWLGRRLMLTMTCNHGDDYFGTGAVCETCFANVQRIGRIVERIKRDAHTKALAARRPAPDAGLRELSDAEVADALRNAEALCRNRHPDRWTTVVEQRTTCLSCKETAVRDVRAALDAAPDADAGAGEDRAEAAEQRAAEVAAKVRALADEWEAAADEHAREPRRKCASVEVELLRGLVAELRALVSKHRGGSA